MSIQNILEKLSIEELKALSTEAKTGAIEARIIAKSKLQESKRCAVCGEEFTKPKGYMLEFGSPDLRKRAHFCAFDCMEYFIGHLKEEL